MNTMTTDVRVERFEEIQKALEMYSTKYRWAIESVGSTMEDFIQDVWYNIFKRKGFNDYQAEKNEKGFRALIFSVASRYLTDLRRKAFGRAKMKDETGNVISVVSLNSLISDDTTLEDLVQSTAPNYAQVFREILERIPKNKQFSPNYELTYRQLFKLTIVKDSKEIAEEVGISNSRIKQLQKMLFKSIQDSADL